MSTNLYIMLYSKCLFLPSYNLICIWVEWREFYISIRNTWNISLTQNYGKSVLGFFKQIHFTNLHRLMMTNYKALLRMLTITIRIFYNLHITSCTMTNIESLVIKTSSVLFFILWLFIYSIIYSLYKLNDLLYCPFIAI